MSVTGSAMVAHLPLALDRRFRYRHALRDASLPLQRHATGQGQQVEVDAGRWSI
jgi:hypothetical protein